MTSLLWDLHVVFKVPFNHQYTIKIGKMGQNFIDVQEVLKFLSGKKNSLIQRIVWIKWVADLIIRRSISSVNSAALWAEKCSSRDLVKVLLEHSHGHLLICCLLAFLLQQQRWATAVGIKGTQSPSNH